MKSRFNKKYFLLLPHIVHDKVASLFKVTKQYTYEAWRRVGWYIIRTKSWKWDHRLYEILKTVPKEKRILYKTVLTNQHNYNEQTRQQSAFYFDSTILVKKILDQLVILDVIGVQPLSAPVGLNFYLKLNEEESDGEMPKLSFSVEQKATEDKSRKFKSRWSLEADQDMMASIQGLDVEKELIQALASEIAREITQEHISNIKQLAKTQPAQLDDPAKFFVQVNMAANSIAQDTRRGPGNFIIMSPMSWAKVFDYVKSTPSMGFKPPEEVGVKMGSMLHVGTIQGNVKIYTEPFTEDDSVIVGYKGRGEIDTGYFFNPYIMLIPSGPIISEPSFEPVMTLMSRYGLTKTDNVEDYYRKLVFE